MVHGADGWMSKERYDVIGITGDLATGTVAEFPQTRRQMKALLADRFALRVDTKQKKKGLMVRVLTHVPNRPATGLRRAAGPCQRRAGVEARAPVTTQCDVALHRHDVRGPWRHDGRHRPGTVGSPRTRRGRDSAWTATSTWSLS